MPIEIDTLDYENILDPYKEISPETYLAIVKTNPKAIREAIFVPPKLGDEDFGKFKVIFSPFFDPYETDLDHAKR